MNDGNRVSYDSRSNVIEEDNGFDDQGMISHLRNELKKSEANIARLKAVVKKDNCVSAESSDIGKGDQSGITNQRNELLKLLFHKDSTIERMSSDIQMLENQLKEAHSAKVDALARLEAFEIKERKRTQTVDKSAAGQGCSTVNEGTLIQHVYVGIQRKSQGTDLTTKDDNQRKYSRENSTDDDVDMSSTSSKSDRTVIPIVDITSDGSVNDSSTKSHREKEDIQSNIQLERLPQLRTRRHQICSARHPFNADRHRDAIRSIGSEDRTAQNKKKIRIEEQSISTKSGRERSRVVIKINKLKFDH